MSTYSGDAPVPPDLLERLRGADPKALNDAVGQLLPILREYARREIQRRGVRSREADTLVDSVLIRCLKPAAERCGDDEELRGYLYNAIRHKVIDQTRKPQHHQFPEEADSSFGPPDAAPSPSEAVEAEEARSHDDAALERFLRAVERASLTPRDRELVNLFVVRGMAWEHVAATLELSNGAARTAMSRARSRLLPQLMAPLRARLREDDWKILEATMIERRRPEDAAAEFGLDAQDMVHRFMFTVFPVIDRSFGSHGMAMLRRLMHKPAGRSKP
jgi:RNA polymerase sigma factor (sigma-70 family)